MEEGKESSLKRGKKRSRGGIGCLLGDEGVDVGEPSNDASSLVHVDVVPLSIVNPLICNDNNGSNSTFYTDQHLDRRRVRIVHPYPYTFATFAKARWIGRTVLDVYSTEFGEC